jgi:hypothetical protein
VLISFAHRSRIDPTTPFFMDYRKTLEISCLPISRRELKIPQRINLDIGVFNSQGDIE